jgi:hypothetical protein
MNDRNPVRYTLVLPRDKDNLLVTRSAWAYRDLKSVEHYLKNHCGIISQEYLLIEKTARDLWRFGMKQELTSEQFLDWIVSRESDYSPFGLGAIPHADIKRIK